MPRTRVLFAMSAVGLAAATLVAVDGGPAAAADTPTTCTDARFFDINRDGYEDLAVASPMKKVQKAAGAGMVTILYGDATGTFGTELGGRKLTMGGLGYGNKAGDHMGASLVVADMNGDHCGDLVVGVPGRSSGAGVVIVIYGAPPQSTEFAVRQVLKQGYGGASGVQEPGDGFGSSLAVTGKNSAGAPTQLWVGSPGEDLGSVKDAGMVHVFPTTTAGATATLPTSGIKTRQQGKGGVSSAAEAGDRFGQALAGSAATVLVGSPGEDAGSVKDAGMVHVFAGATVHGYTAETSGVPGASETGDQFGSALAIAESCKGPGSDAWIIGVPLEDVGSAANAGNVIVGDRGTGTWTTLQQGTGAIGGSAGSGNRFGFALNATGSTDRDRAVIAIGAPNQSVGSVKRAGTVTTLSLTCPATALVAVGVTAWNQGSTGIAGDPNTDDQMGKSLGSARVPVSGSQAYRLIISIPAESEASEDGLLVHAGRLLVLPGTADGFTATGSTLFGQGSLEDAIPSLGKEGDAFGSGLDSASAGR